MSTSGEEPKTDVPLILDMARPCNKHRSRAVTLRWDSSEDRTGHAVNQRHAADDQAASLALIDEAISNPLAGVMVPGNQ